MEEFLLATKKDFAKTLHEQGMNDIRFFTGKLLTRFAKNKFR